MPSKISIKTTGRQAQLDAEGVRVAWATDATGQIVRTEVENELTYPTSLADAIEMASGDESVVLDFVKREMTIKYQAFIRGRIEGGKSQYEINKDLEEYNVFEQKAPSDPVQKVLKQTQNLSQEQIQALLARLQG